MGLYWKDSKGRVSYPYKSHDLWFLTESVRWGFLPKETLANAKTLIDGVKVVAAELDRAKSISVSERFNPSLNDESSRVRPVHLGIRSGNCVSPGIRVSENRWFSGSREICRDL